MSPIVHITEHKREYMETRTEMIIPKVHAYRVWAAKNAYTLGTIAVMFIIQLIVIIVVGAIYGTP